MIDGPRRLLAVHTARRPEASSSSKPEAPGRQAWRAWSRADPYQRVGVLGVGPVQTWAEVTDVTLPFVTFRDTIGFEDDGSDPDARFRSRQRVEAHSNAPVRLAGRSRRPELAGTGVVFVAQRTG